MVALYRATVVSLLAIVLVFMPNLFLKMASADPIQNARTERIGNYDFQMTTDPKDPMQGAPVKILFRVATVDGSDLIDVPIVIRIVDSNGTLVQKTNPIILPAGHYTYQTTFDTAGRKVIYVDLSDNEFTGQTITFTFFTNVSSPYDFLYIAIPALAAAIISILVLRHLRRKKSRIKSADAQ
jgi:hypothetical protein